MELWNGRKKSAPDNKRSYNIQNTKQLRKDYTIVYTFPCAIRHFFLSLLLENREQIYLLNYLNNSNKPIYAYSVCDRAIPYSGVLVDRLAVEALVLGINRDYLTKDIAYYLVNMNNLECYYILRNRTSKLY